MRVLSALAIAILLAAFVLPSLAIYTAANDTPWDDIVDVCPEVLVPALLVPFFAPLMLTGRFAARTPEVTHPVSMGARLFQLDCALIC